jgi:hypothetical protein
MGRRRTPKCIEPGWPTIRRNPGQPAPTHIHPEGDNRDEHYYYGYMVEHLTFHQTSFDTVHIARPDRGFTAAFFEVGPYPYLDGASRVTEFDEKLLVRWLMLVPFSRQLIFGQLAIPNEAWYAPEVVQPFYMPGEGDIDLMVCPRLSPHLAIALECKRVKVESLNVGQDRVNKLQGVAGGVHQANNLYHGPFAFFQTYLCILTEVNASQDERNIPNRGVRPYTTPERGDTKRTTFRQIVEFPGRDDLHTDVGIIFIEIVQPSRLSIDKQATVRVCVYCRAEKRDQPNSITNRVREIMQ